MAKILYGVAGEGFGHSSRSHLTAQRLIDAGHEVMFAASNKSYKYLEKYFSNSVTKVHGLTFYYQNAGISLPKTLLSNLAGVPQMIKTNHKAFTKTYPAFAPDVVITDFEPFTAFWAYMHNVPCLSIDHEHFLCKCRFDKPGTNFLARFSSESVTKNYLTGVDSHIVLNFFKTTPANEKVRLSCPVVRSELFEHPASDEGDYIIVYGTTESSVAVFVEVAKQFPRQCFHIYGMDYQGSQGNLIFKGCNQQEFLYGLSRCRGVMATGGFSLISECLHYRKKMFVKPIDMQVEQIINAYYLAKMGGGMYVNTVNKAALQTFIDWLDEPYELDEGLALIPDNESYFSLLANMLEELTDGRVVIRQNLQEQVCV